MILHPYFSFTNDPQGVVVVPPSPVSVGGGIPSRKRQKRVWARIGDKAVYGTQRELEAYYEAVVAATVGEPVQDVPELKTRPATKAKPKVAPEVVKAPELDYPGADWEAMWRDLVARQELASADALANVIRARIIRDRMLEEDDEEVLLLL